MATASHQQRAGAADEQSSADIDLRDFQYMPLKIERLQKSKAWLECKREPELAFYLMNLWMRAWHEIPAGSIDDDDDVLADAAMCPMPRWRKIRDKVLRKWEKRADGRLYHPVVTEIAEESWTAKCKQRDRTAAAREAKLSQRPSSGSTRSVTEDATEPATDIATDVATISVTDNVTASKGREGKRREERKASASLNSEPRRDGPGEPIADALPKDEKSTAKPTHNYDMIERKCREAAGLENDQSQGLFNLSPIIGLLDAGYDLDGDIVPILRAVARSGRKGKVWGYYVEAVQQSRSQRRKAANGAAPNGHDHDTTPETEEQKLSRLRREWDYWIRNHDWPFDGPNPDCAGCEIPADLVEKWRGEG